MYSYIVVDDETLIRKGTIKKLDSLKDTVKCVGEASNGKEALYLIEELKPDIIITDMNMPVLDGVEFLSILSKSYPQIHVIVISGYNDYTYMRQAITSSAVDYILKPFSKEDIQSSVMKSIQLIEDNTSLQKQIIFNEAEIEEVRYVNDIQMLKNLILGYHNEMTEITSKRLHYIMEMYNLFMITLHSTDVLSETLLQDYLDEIGLSDLALYLQVYNSYLGIFVLFLPEKSALKPVDYSKLIIEQLGDRLCSEHITVTFGVSKLHKELLMLRTAFLETVDAMNSMKLTDVNHYFYYDEVRTIPHPINWDKNEELIFRIEAGMTDKIPELLNDLFHYCKSSPTITLADVKNYFLSVSEHLKLIMKEYYDQIHVSSTSTSMQNALNSMFSIAELQDYFTRFLQNLSEAIKPKSVYAIDDTIEKMKVYVQRNYRNDLTIEFLSSLFYMNRSYCSHLFKEKTKQNFNDYVNNIRIGKAKELLSTSDKKNYQISKAVGYSNEKYFFRVFKKMTGITPEQYRNQAIRTE